jgi:predicted aconitase with swiveling domain
MDDGFRELVSGAAEGPALVLVEPLSFWGGLAPESGEIIDAHHPQLGTVVTGAILFMPSGRGSSSSSSTFLEAVRRHTHPAALVLAEEDDILTLSALVARSLYAVSVPVGVLPRPLYDRVQTGDHVSIASGGLWVQRAETVIIPRSGD